MTSEEELKSWFPEKIVKLKSGQEIEVPKLTWGLEIQFFRLISKVLKQFPEKFTISGDDPSAALALFSKVLDELPREITSFLAKFLKKDESWVENNLSMEDVVNILVPLFKKFGENIGKIAPT